MGWLCSKSFVAQSDSLALDLVAKRYGIRPSKIVGLDDWEGIQFDIALALKGHRDDNDRLSQVLNSALERIDNGFEMIVKTLGGKVKKRKKAPTPRPNLEPSDRSEPPPLNQVLAQLGGRGVVVVRKEKNGK